MSWPSSSNRHCSCSSVCPRTPEEYSEAYRLCKFLRYFADIEDHALPFTSLLREFLGGSSFRY